MSQVTNASSTSRDRGSQSLSQPVVPSSQSRSQPRNDSGNESQATTVSNDTDRVFTPSGSDSEGSTTALVTDHASSQESQLMQLSQLAATQQRMMTTTGLDESLASHGQSKKRMADGVVKHPRSGSSASSVRPGHSRNTSAVSAASTSGSRIGELSAELKAKLSYAMVKVNNGWQSHSIDEIESLASQAASPTSSTSTLHGRYSASTSPRISVASATRPRAPSTIITSPVGHHPPHSRTYESFWRDSHGKPSSATTSPISQVPALAPPAPIQPRQPGYTNPRRNSNAKYAPAYLSHSHHTSPHTPAQPSPLQNTPGQRSIRTPNVDPILFSPHQNMREQEALETLVFMSSPGNSANLKHTYGSAHASQPSQPSQPRSSGRTALPTSRLGPGSETSSQGRKSLPTGRLHPHHAPQAKRVGFDKSPSNYGEMDIDDQPGSAHIRSTPRRRTNGHAPKPSLSLPAGLSGPSRPRSTLRSDDIERMLDRVAGEASSDSEGEIHLPQNRRRNSASLRLGY
ncbi:hypothetical protein F4779DRAFT_251882 [Xylariaceae sp. FL0662B]|nr:hypothetical protein F4779DRAFT_251882 [Xylariaceae sp. FL0662B]